MKCLACGTDKDLNVQAVYPCPEDDCLHEGSLPQLLTVECRAGNGPGYRMVVMCHECWHRLETGVGIDMWISQGCWETLNPVTPYERLPEVKKDENGHTVWPAMDYEGSP